MDRLQLFGIVLFGVFMIFYSGSAIKCYDCNSYFQQDCADWFNNRTHNLKDCGDDIKLCRKIVQEVFYLDQWEVRYIRQCAKAGEVGGDEGRQCVVRYGSYKLKMTYCHCNNQEGCNSAVSMNFSLCLLILPFLTVLGLLYSNSLTLT